MTNNTQWTEARVKVLRDMWGKFSPALIAERLSTTRNAVIGKADRIGLRGNGPLEASKNHNRLPPEEAARRRKAREIARTEKRRAERKIAKPEPKLPLLVIPRRRQAPAWSGNPVTLLDAGAGQCRWIVGNEGQGKDTLCCGGSVAPDACRPFCDEHARRAMGRAAQPAGNLAAIDNWSPAARVKGEAA